MARVTHLALRTLRVFRFSEAFIFFRAARAPDFWNPIFGAWASLEAATASENRDALRAGPWCRLATFPTNLLGFDHFRLIGHWPFQQGSTWLRRLIIVAV